MTILVIKSTVLIVLNYNQGMRIQTKRLILRKVTASDAAFYLDLFTDPGFIANINDKGLNNVQQVKHYLEEKVIPEYCVAGMGFFTVIEASTNKPIGVSSILQRKETAYKDIGYAFLPAGRGKGYATEATLHMMHYANNVLKESKIIALTSPKNTASQRVLEKLHFTYVGLKEIQKEKIDCMYEYNF